MLRVHDPLALMPLEVVSVLLYAHQTTPLPRRHHPHPLPSSLQPEPSCA